MGQMTTGRYTYGNPQRMGDMNIVNIGSFCSFAGGVWLDGGFQHNMKSISTYPFPTNFQGCSHLNGHVICKGDITIGNDVWVGEQAMIMSGVTIGDGAVIGFRSVISKNVGPYEVVAGAPQKLIRKRFSNDEINTLLFIKWWNWTDEQIRGAAPLLMSSDIDGLHRFYLNNIQ